MCAGYALNQFDIAESVFSGILFNIIFDPGSGRADYIYIYRKSPVRAISRTLFLLATVSIHANVLLFGCIIFYIFQNAFYFIFSVPS